MSQENPYAIQDDGLAAIDAAPDARAVFLQKTYSLVFAGVLAFAALGFPVYVRAASATPFVAVLIAWSVLFSVPGALQAPASLKGGTLQRSLLENRPEQVFLSATGAHYASGVLIREKKILELQDAADVPRFLDRLRGNKIERFCYVSHSITPYRRSAVDREARDILEHTPGLRRTYEGGDKVIGIRCYALEPGGPGIFGGE